MSTEGRASGGLLHLSKHSYENSIFFPFSKGASELSANSFDVIKNYAPLHSFCISFDCTSCITKHWQFKRSENERTEFLKHVQNVVSIEYLRVHTQ